MRIFIEEITGQHSDQIRSCVGVGLNKNQVSINTTSAETEGEERNCFLLDLKKSLIFAFIDHLLHTNTYDGSGLLKSSVGGNSCQFIERLSKFYHLL